MAVYLHKTKTGKVIYRRKVHTFLMSDVLRIVQRLRRFNESEARLAGVVIAILAVGIEEYEGKWEAGLSLWRNPPPWFVMLERWMNSQEGRAYATRNPAAVPEIISIYEQWKAYLAIHFIKEITEGVESLQ